MNKKQLILTFSLLGVFSLSSCDGGNVNSSSSHVTESNSSSSFIEKENHVDDLMANLLSLKSLKSTFVLNTQIASSTGLPTLGTNTVEIEGTFDLNLLSLEEISCHLVAEGDYNDAKINLEATYVDSVAYAKVSLPENDDALRYSLKEENFSDVISFITKVSGLSLPTFDGDFNSILSSLIIKETKETSTGYEFSLTFEGEKPITLTLESNKDCELTGVTGNFLVDGSIVSLSMDIEMSTTESLMEISAPSDASSYQNFVNTLEVFDQIADLANNQQFGFSLEISSFSTPNSSTPIVGDDSSLLIDVDGAYDKKAEKGKFTLTCQEKEGDASQQASILFDNEYGYLDYQNSLKLKFAQSDLDEFTSLLMADYPLEEGFFENIFAFLLETPAVTEILLGDYSSLLDALVSLKQEENAVYVTFEGRDFGLGNDSLCTISLTNESLLGISLENFSINGYSFGLDFVLKEFTPIEIEQEQYVTIHALPTMYQQFASLIENPRFNIGIAGIFENGNSLNGVLQVNAKTEEVSLSLSYKELYLDQNNAEAQSVPYTHKVLLDYQNSLFALSYNLLGENESEVTPDEQLKGVLSKQSINDIGNVLSSLMQGRLGELFSNSLGNIALISALEQAENGDWHDLLSFSLFTGVSHTEKGIQIALNPSLLGKEGSLFLLVSQKETGEIESICFSGDVVGGEITFSLEAKEENVVPVTDYETASDSYLVLDSLSILTNAIVKDTELTAHHIGISLDLNAIISHPVIEGDIYIDSSLDPVIYVDVTRTIKSEVTTIQILVQDGFVMSKIGEETSKVSTDEYSASLMDNIMNILGLESSLTSMMEEDTSHPVYGDSIVESYAYNAENRTFSLSMDLGDLSRMSVMNTALGSLPLNLLIDENGYLNEINFDCTLLSILGGLIQITVKGNLNLLDIGESIPQEIIEEEVAFAEIFSSL